MTLRCTVCGKTFPIAARISVRTRMPPFSGDNQSADPSEKIIEKACCPYCDRIEIEEVKA
jgi:hypothetical protein